jgi:hypothetical protein
MPALRPPPPQTHCGDLADPPKALVPLCLLPHWVTWRWERSGHGFTKPPFRATAPDRHAANNDPSTWSPRAAAVDAVLAGKANGIGFVLTDTDIGAIDLDKCRNQETGAIDAWAQTILDLAPNAYKEITVSGEGLRIIGIATGAEVHRRFNLAGRKGAGVELYRRATRYITISGLEIGTCSELPNIDQLIDKIASRRISTNTKGQNSHSSNAGGNGLDDIDRLIKHGAPEGQRSEAFSRVVWSLAGQGLSLDQIEEELGRHPNGIASKYTKRLRGEIELCYYKRERVQTVAAASFSHNWDEPDVSILDDRRGVLPEFPDDIFAPTWREWLKRASHGAGVRAEHVAIPLLGVASSLIGTSRRVRASRSWSEPMTLWAAIVGHSGDRKTPGLRVVTRALDLIEAANSAATSAKRISHETKVQAAKELQKRWKEERQAALDDSPPREPPPMPADAFDPGNFIEPRLYATDPTIERLAALLLARPRGMMLIRDELSALFANMSRYSGGSDRPFWLEAWNGGRHVVERVSGSIVVDHLLVGVIGSFQPDKLARAFAGDEDGMYARFLYAWPLSPEYRPLTNEVSEVEPELQSALTALIRLPSEDESEVFFAQYVPLSEDALSEFEKFRKYIDQEKHALDGPERHWFSKGETIVLRLAGTLSFMAWAIALGTPSGNGIEGISGALEPKVIDGKFVTDAVRLWRDFLWPHARACLRQLGLSDKHKNARRVLRWISTHGKTEIGRDEIRQNALARTLDAQGTQVLLESLERAGWLRGETIKTAGRPRMRWAVNPKLFSARGLPEIPQTPESPY